MSNVERLSDSADSAAAPRAASDAASAALSAEPATFERLLRALAGLAIFATVLGVGRHVFDAVTELMPVDGALGERLASVSLETWAFSAIHVVCALASLGIGYLLISYAYPFRGLARLAVTNPAAAIQTGSHLLGAVVIATVSWGGADATSLGISAAFCGLGWLAVIALCAGHRLVTKYHDHEEILAGNTAAALASAGFHLAVALVVGHAIEGQFQGWRDSLIAFGFALVWVLALYPLRQLVLARVILRISPDAMDTAIMTRRDHALGAAEGLCYVISALSLVPAW
jgi:uncharacterized membrane protein YjfL (UPF0719 family)